MRMLIRPPRLEPGATVGIVAPASAPPDPKAIDQSVAALERLGFKPRLAPNVRKRWGFLAGTDRERAADLMTMFTNSRVQGIICVRGGYGSGRLLPLLNYERIRENPKVLIGYSDITSLHCALLKCSGLVSFHGPMLNSDFIKDDLPEFTRRSFLRALKEPAPIGDIAQGYQGKTVQVLRGGRATGRLLGGNISLLCALVGTPFLPSFRESILFFEDLDEVPYRFDRMLTQLLHSGVLKAVRGVAIGINKNCKDPRAKTAKEYRQTVEDVFKERLLPLKVPVLTGLPFGHVRLNATLPVGVQVTLDADRGQLLVMEPAVV